MTEPEREAVRRLRDRAQADPVTTADGEPPATAAAVPRRRRAGGRTGSRTGGLPVVVVAAVTLAILVSALAALVGARLGNRNAVSDARVAALAAATSGVATVLSYDYRHLDRDFAKAESLLTPQFRKQYDKTTAAGVKPLAAKYRAVSSADVTAGGVVSAAPSRAVVLVLVSQTVTNSQLAAPRLDRSRIDVTLVERGGRWLIDRLDPI